LRRSDVPSRDALQVSIDRLNFDLKLHPEFTPFEDSGFLPFSLSNEDGPGFEISYDEATEIFGEDEEFSTLANGRDYCISMVWRGSMKDLACVMIVSCALTKDFGAVVSYEGDAPDSLSEMIAATKQIIIDAANEV
jgi:hypothetical protein